MTSRSQLFRTGSPRLAELAALTIVGSFVPRIAFAEELTPPPPSFWSAWSLEPVTTLAIWIAGLWYLAGVRRLWSQPAGSAALPAWRVISYFAGLVALLLAIVSPIHVYGEYLLSLHMVQHLLLTLVAAPLIVLGDPLLAMLWALPSSQRRAVGLQLAPSLVPHRVSAWLFQPLFTFAVHVLVFLLWHIPAAYSESLRNETVHYVQHVTFFGTALLFWWPIVETAPARRVMSYPFKLLYIFFAMVLQEKIVGGILTFVREPIYEPYVQLAPLWNTTALQDQQLAGIIMMTGGFVLYLIAFTVVFFSWVSETERQDRQRQADVVPGLQAPTGVGGEG